MRYLLIAALLGGCSLKEAAIRDAERSAATYGPACDKLGYERNSDGWRDCVIRLSDKRR